MRHRKKGKIFSRERGARVSLMRNLAESLILHEKMVTTVSKAKAVKPLVERMVTRAKSQDVSLSDRRALLSDLPNREAVNKLLQKIAPRYRDRKGGYLRVTKMQNRSGDGAPLAQIEF